MIKKAMVLAAGLGTRLRPLTDSYPKPLVPIANEPLLGIHLRQLAALGIEEVMVNLHHLPEAIQDTLGEGREYGVKLHYSLEEPEIMGTGGGLAQVASFFAQEEAFLYINGDILHDIDLGHALQAHRAHKAAATLLLRPHPGDGKTGWIGVDQEGWVRRVPEMEATPSLQQCMFTGMHIITPQLLPFLRQGEFGCILRTGYRHMLEAGHPVWGHQVHDAPWRDIGNPASYLEANWWQLRQRLLHGKAQTISSDSTVLLGANVNIGEGVAWGQYVIVGDGAEIEAHARLDHCVVLPGASVRAGHHYQHAIVMKEGVIEVGGSCAS